MKPINVVPGRNKPTVTFGVAAPKAIKWLLDQEMDVRNHVKNFCLGQAEARFAVAGPMSFANQLKLASYKREHGDIPRHMIESHLPTITITLRLIKHHLTGEPGVHVHVSDADLDKVVQWWREAPFRKSINPVLGVG